MTTASGRTPARRAAVLLLALLGCFLVTAMSALGAADAENASHAGSVVPPPPPPSPSPPAAAAQPTLTLSVYEGPPGTTVHAEGSGYNGECKYGDNEFPRYRFNLEWDGKELATVDLDRTDSDYGKKFSTDFQVPPEVVEAARPTGTAGKHQIIAKCSTRESSPAIFTVPPAPTLSVIPGEGRPGALFTVEGAGYSNCNYDCAEGGQSPQVKVVWDASEVIATAVMRNDGTFTAENVRVPQTATQGSRQVVGRFGAESAGETFVVQPPRPPLALTVSPSEGLPDTPTPFTVRGSGYSSSSCLEYEFPTVDVLWDESVELASAPIGNDGEFEANVSVPPGRATPGKHLVSGQCGEENPTAIFTIPPSPTVTLIPDQRQPGELFTVNGSGYSHCNYDCVEGARSPQVEVVWASTGEVISTAVLSDQGTFSAVDVPVPPTAEPGEHQVIARFDTESAQATFVVLPPLVLPSPTLALYPDEGRPGSLFEVEGSGYSPCDSENCPPVDVLWGADNEKIGTGTMDADGGFAVDVTVPQNAAAPGSYQVVARFGEENAAATFVVVPPPVLKLTPNEGRTGTTFTVEGSGYGRCFGTCSYASEVSQARVQVLWVKDKDEDGEVLATAEMLGGTFKAENVPVPPTAAPGEYSVVGRFGAEDASEPFTVEPPPVPPDVLGSTLTPDKGRPGDFVTIEGSGYNNCPDRGNRVVNIYDRNTPDSNGFRHTLARDVPISEQGTFSTVVQIPPTAAAGNHEINVQCFGGREYASTTFAVTDPSGSVPGQAGSASDPSGLAPGSSLPEFPLPPPDEVPDNVSGLGNENRAFLTTQVPAPTEVFESPLQLLWGILLALLLVVIVAFPADLFNNTYEKNRGRIDGWFGKWFHWVPRFSRQDLPSWVHLDILGVVAAVLLLMVVVRDPGLDYATLAQAVGYLIAVPLVVVVLELSGEFYSRWKGAGSTRPQRHSLRGLQWRVVSSALLVAGFLAILSKLAGFSPPYIYGLIAIYLGADRLLSNLNADEEKEEKGRRAMAGMLFLFAVSAIAWFVWGRLDQAFDRGLDGFGWLIADAVLATFFLLGLETAIFGLVPLTFLKGKELWQWKRTFWVVTFVPVAFLFVVVQLVVRRVADPTLSEMIEAIALFVAFGIFSVLFWGYFHPAFQNLQRQFSHSVRR